MKPSSPLIDEKSVSELGRWPWPRTTMARLVDQFKAGGAKAVGFDIVFSEPDDNASLKTIDALTAEMKKSGVSDTNIIKLLARKRTAADTDARFWPNPFKKPETSRWATFFIFRARKMKRTWHILRRK